MQKRVVVTGVGPVSSIGVGKNSFWESARRGRGYYRTVDFPDIDLEQFRSRICSPVDNLNLTDYFENPKKLLKSGNATQYSVLGTLLALQDAGVHLYISGRNEENKPQMFRIEDIDFTRCGVILGQSVTNSDIMLPNHAKFLANRGPKKMHPFTLPQSNPNVGASTVSEWFFLKGTCYTVATACSSSTHAIGLAAMHIQTGMEDLMVAGGADATMEPYFMSGFDIIRALSRRNDDPMRASRPFDRNRDGFVLGEGAGILILEELGHALRRGAHIYGEIVGYGFTTDAYNVVAPDPRGEAAICAISKALEMAKITPEEMEYINAHGTSTVLNDPNESYIIKQVFGDYAYRIPISSSKSYFGHPIGAAGALESIVTLLIMVNGVIAPTINLVNPDTEYVDKCTPELDKRCDLDYVPNVARKKNVSVALNESFGFGGQNAVLICKKYENGKL
jgi:3-oxoacyl-[acyl-carrier-protein] synthase II